MSTPAGDGSRILVRKYGGSSLSSVERIRDVAAQIAALHAEGYRLVVVVSAMGHTTDELNRLAAQVSPDPPRRELDMLLSVGERISMSLLSMALEELGCPAISYTGSQCGLITDESHTAAEILEVRPDRVRRSLDAGHVVVVAGFQGVSRQREITTLGRGGSDATAVALAAALGAECCEICKDVDGVFTADPHRLGEARRYATLSYDDLETLTAAGSEVVHPRAVAYARRHGVPLRITSSFHTAPGTRVGPRTTTVPAGASDRGRTESPAALRGRPLGLVTADRQALLELAADAGPLGERWRAVLRRDLPADCPVYEAGTWGPEGFRWWLIGPDTLLARLAERLPRPGAGDDATFRLRRGLALLTLAGRPPHHWPAVLETARRHLQEAQVTDWSCRSDTTGLRFLVPPAAADRLAAALHTAFLAE